MGSAAPDQCPEPCKKAAEADEEVNKIKGTRNRKEAESAMGFASGNGDNISHSQTWQNPGSSMTHRLPSKHDQEAYDAC